MVRESRTVPSSLTPNRAPTFVPSSLDVTRRTIRLTVGAGRLLRPAVSFEVIAKDDRSVGGHPIGPAPAFFGQWLDEALLFKSLYGAVEVPG